MRPPSLRGTRIRRRANEPVQKNPDMSSQDAPAEARPAREKNRPVVRRESSRKTRETIIDAALAEFSSKGYDGGRVDEIALRAGINKNVLYHHFGNKDDLFTAVLEYTYDAIRSRQKDLQIRGMDPVTGMRRLVIFTGQVWVRFPEFQRILASENLNQGKHIVGSANIREMYNPLLETIRDLLARGTEEGLFRSDVDAVDLYISITSLTAHYVSNRYTFEAIFGQRLMTAQRVKQRLDHAAEMVLRYVQADRPALPTPATSS
jgi:TetR/AcrR family transcriptional regulator